MIELLDKSIHKYHNLNSTLVCILAFLSIFYFEAVTRSHGCTSLDKKVFKYSDQFRPMKAIHLAHVLKKFLSLPAFMPIMPVHFLDPLGQLPYTWLVAFKLHWAYCIGSNCDVVFGWFDLLLCNGCHIVFLGLRELNNLRFSLWPPQELGVW